MKKRRFFLSISMPFLCAGLFAISHSPSVVMAQALVDTIPGEVGTAFVDSTGVKTIVTQIYENPVVIVGPATYHDCDPGVIRVSWDSNAYFNLRYQEWEYLDGDHFAEEISYLIIDEGRYLLTDGREIEVGKVSISETGNMNTPHFSFNSAFPATPHLFLSTQSVNGSQAAFVRAREVTANGFQAGLWEQETLMDGHNPEDVGYIAIYDPDNGGILPLTDGDVFYDLSYIEVDSEWTTAYDTWLRMEEERSDEIDDETDHVLESLSVLKTDTLLFAQDITTAGHDTATVRRLSNCN